MYFDFERVHIINRNNKSYVENAITHSSVIVSHLDNEPNAIQTAVVAERPLVLVIHNNYRILYYNLTNIGIEIFNESKKIKIYSNKILK